MHLFVSKCVISKCVSYFEIFIQVCIGLTMSLKHLFLSDLHISLRICSFNGWNGKFWTKNLTFCFIYKSMALVIIYLFNSFVKQKAIQFFLFGSRTKTCKSNSGRWNNAVCTYLNKTIHFLFGNILLTLFMYLMSFHLVCVCL